MPSPLHSQHTLRLTLEVTDPNRLHEYVMEQLGPEAAAREDPLSVCLREEVIRVASQIPGVALRGFSGGVTESDSAADPDDPPDDAGGVREPKPPSSGPPTLSGRADP